MKEQFTQRLKKIEDVLKSEGVKQITFLGKVSKTVLIKRPKFDSRAVEFIKRRRWKRFYI